MTGTPILSSRPREAIIALGLTYLEARLRHESGVSGRDSSVTGGLSWANESKNPRKPKTPADASFSLVSSSSGSASATCIQPPQDGYSSVDACWSPPFSDASLTAQAPAQSPRSRDNKTGPENSGGGTSISGPHAPGAGANSELSRGTTCIAAYRSASLAPPKSPDKNYGSPTKLSVEISEGSPSSYGHTKLLQLLLQSAGVPKELLSDGCLANLTRLIPSSPQPCTKSSGGID